MVPGFSGVRGDAVAGPSRGRAQREQHVCRLGLSVGQPRIVRTKCEVEIVKDHGREQVATGGHRDDARTSCRGQALYRPSANSKCPRWLAANCVSQPSDVRVSSGNASIPGVVDEDVQRAIPRRCERRDRRAVGQLKMSDEETPTACLRGDVGRRTLACFEVLDRKRYLRSRRCQRAGGLRPDPHCRASDDRASAVQVNAGRTSSAVGIAGERGRNASVEVMVILFPRRTPASYERSSVAATGDWSYRRAWHRRRRPLSIIRMSALIPSSDMALRSRAGPCTNATPRSTGRRLWGGRALRLSR